MAEYREWYDKVHCPAAGILPNAPTVGLVLQKSHIATKDDGHYAACRRALESGLLWLVIETWWAKHSIDATSGFIS